MPTDRLVPEPVFLLSPPRSGSTLLRSVLDSHSRIRAPHELHLRHLEVHLGSDSARLSMQALGQTPAGLRHLLWDRILHDLLSRSGKSVLVEKSPCNLGIFDELRDCWPAARFVLLLRHPGAIVRSMAANFPDLDRAGATRRLLELDQDLQRIRQQRPDLYCLRYEDLIRSPGPVIAQLCTELGVRFEPGMLDYGRQDHGPFRYGLGDWGEQIHSGRIRPRPTGEPPARDENLVRICRAWNYDLSDAGSP